jgi:hypothetical protein
MTNRSQNGYSLILVSSLGLIAVLTAVAVSAALVPTYRNIGAQGVSKSTASAAEVGIQYALAQLNAAASGGSLGSFTSPIVVPTPITSNINVVVTMTSLNPTKYPNLASSATGADPIFNTYAYNSLNATDYRMLTSVATYGLNQSTVNVIVGPIMALPSASVSSNPLFSYALFGGNNIQLNGNVNVMTEGSQANQASIGSNNQIGLLGTNTVDGNIDAYNPSKTATSILASPNSTINGSINYNGNISNVTAGGNFPFTADTPANVALFTAGAGPQPNVLADGTIGQQIGALTPGAATVTNQASVPGINSSSPAIMTVGGPQEAPNIINVAPSSLSSVSDLGAVNLANNQVMVVTPGNYTASSINISGNAQIQVSIPASPPPNSPQGVSITIQGNSLGTTPISIGGNGIVPMPGGHASPAASNFQLFYNGTESIQITMSPTFNSFYGLLYAPNATVNLNTGSTGAFHGAIAANNLTASGNGQILFNPSSINPSSGGSGGVAAGPGYTTPGTAAQMFNVLSWQEPTRSGAP